ncbi:hypothetical protein ES703_23052 [subsurface metagenome]
MTWWTIVGTGHEPGFTHLRVHASTSAEDHLYMAWATYRPTQQEIWRTVRGKSVFCGYKYIWDTPNVAEQTQQGDTLFHSFYISGIEAGSEVWYYLNAPYGPTDREIQGPLMHVHLLKPAAWSTRAYFASRTKGMFKTADLSGPGGPQPTWIPDNAGLPFLDIRQATSDPWDPYHRRFIVCHGDVYRMDNLFLEDPATATRILAQWDAVYLTGGHPGDILWIATNPILQGHLYVMFNSDLTTNGTWCLKSIDLGETWTAHQIYPGAANWFAGNIQVGLTSLGPPYDAGHLLYAALNCYDDHRIALFRSTDEGATWHPCSDQPPGASFWTPRLYIEPENQAIVYLGVELPTQDLWRTTSSGAAWALCDQGNALGIMVSPDFNHAVMITQAGNPDAIRVLTHLHIWKSSDFGEIWRDQAETQYDVRHMHVRDGSYDFLYLARITDTPTTGGIYHRHVLFVSDDEGSNMFGKAGAHAGLDDGGGDSIPWNCGGVAQEGILTLP